MPRNFPKVRFGMRAYSSGTGFIRTTTVTGARRRGQLYRNACIEFNQRYAGCLVPLVPFYDEQGAKWCQPDRLIINPHKGLITIVEAKLRHTNDACLLFSVCIFLLFIVYSAGFTVRMRGSLSLVSLQLLLRPVPTLCAYPDNPPGDSSTSTSTMGAKPTCETGVFALSLGIEPRIAGAHGTAQVSLARSNSVRRTRRSQVLLSPHWTNPWVPKRVWAGTEAPRQRYVGIGIFRDGAKTSLTRLFTSKRIAYGVRPYDHDGPVRRSRRPLGAVAQTPGAVQHPVG